jgi:hypothetical protein
MLLHNFKFPKIAFNFLSFSFFGDFCMGGVKYDPQILHARKPRRSHLSLSLFGLRFSLFATPMNTI